MGTTVEGDNNGEDSGDGKDTMEFNTTVQGREPEVSKDAQLLQPLSACLWRSGLINGWFRTNGSFSRNSVFGRTGERVWGDKLASGMLHFTSIKNLCIEIPTAVNVEKRENSLVPESQLWVFRVTREHRQEGTTLIPFWLGLPLPISKQ